MQKFELVEALIDFLHGASEETREAVEQAFLARVSVRQLALVLSRDSNCRRS